MLQIDSKKQGAELTSIQYNGKEILFQGEKILDEDGKIFWNRQAPILFPIVGKLKNGKTQIEEKSYEMSQHGFARDMEFQEILKIPNKHQYILKSNEETLKKYPYKFELRITYEIVKDTLNVTYEVKNTEQNKRIYFGIGAHPAFNCEYITGEYEIVFPQEENKIKFLKLKEGLVEKEKAKNILIDNKIKLTQDSFNEDAIIMKNIKSDKIILQNNKTNQKMLEFTFTGFPYLAIWSKKGAPFICIEPWQNTADTIDSTGIFKEKENVIKLEKQETFSCNYNICFCPSGDISERDIKDKN